MSAAKPKYPDVHVQLTGEDGNAFMVIGLVSKGLKRAKVSEKEREEFRKQAMASSSYDALLRTAMAWVDVS